MRNLADADVCYARPTAIPKTWLANNTDIANAAVVSAIEKFQSTIYMRLKRISEALLR